MGGVIKAIGNILGFSEPKAPKMPDIPEPVAQPIMEMKQEPTSPELGYSESALAGKKKRGKSSLKIQKSGPGVAASGANIT